MNDVSDEISIDFKLDSSLQMDSRWMKKRNAVLFARIHGDLIIKSNTKYIYKQADILLLEFACLLKKWQTSFLNGERKDFSYRTMDFDEGPILEFKYIKEDDMFLITSIWEEDQAFVQSNKLLLATDDFYQRFSTNMKSTYSINIKRFLNKI